MLKICFFFFGLNFVSISLDSSMLKNQFLGPSREVPLWALFSFFFFLFFSRFFFFVFFLAFDFSFFSFFVHFFIFLFFKNVFHFLKKICFSFLFSCIPFKYVLLLASVSEFLTVSSVVGAPWRCGVLTTQGGIAGTGLGRLLAREHDSTPTEWSGGSSPVKTAPLQILLLLLFQRRVKVCDVYGHKVQQRCKSLRLIYMSQCLLLPPPAATATFTTSCRTRTLPCDSKGESTSGFVFTVTEKMREIRPQASI